MAPKPTVPKGTRDFSPTELAKRNHLFAVLKKSFQTFGFQPIETPSFEKSSTLLGKYGEEGDRLIFKILNSGDYLNKTDTETLLSKDSAKLSSQITEKALRYDLTVPFARYVVQHQNELEMPFKRFQIQPVWRADRPQKGRFREFFQCDADVVGSQSLWQEIEFIQLYDTVFDQLGLEGTEIKLNHRKILLGIAETIGAKENVIDFTVALDKLDKIGEAGVAREMLAKGISEAAIAKAAPLFSFSGTNSEKLDQLAQFLTDSKAGLQGVDELRFVVDQIAQLSLQSSRLAVDLTLARGLNYYTGAIFEVAAPKSVQIGSIGGGGRYDDLTGIFGLKNMSGVGISFGLDRIYLAMEALDLFEDIEATRPQVVFVNFGDQEALYCTKAIQKLRAQGIQAELYPEAVKLKKQLNYAHKRKVPYVVLVGSQEVQAKTYTLKNMQSGEQLECDMESLLQMLNNS